MLTNKINVLPDWPSQSPDLNPIEHLWSELGRRIRNRPQVIKNITELETALQEEWSKISMNQIISLIESMPRRIEAVISSNGWPKNTNLYIVTSLVKVSSVKMWDVIIMCNFV